MDQFSGSWHEFTRHFSRNFSTQGRNIKHLHARWRSFSFDPNTYDIEEYIQDVCGAVKQLAHDDDAVLTLLKAIMPTELYGTLYGHDTLYVVITMLKDICQETSAYSSSCCCWNNPRRHSSFHPHLLPTKNAQKAQNEASLVDRIAQLTETLYHISNRPGWKTSLEAFQTLYNPTYKKVQGSF